MENFTSRDRFRDPGLNGTKLNLVLEKCSLHLWTGFVWLSQWCLTVVNVVMKLGVMFWLAKRLSEFQEESCCV